MDADALLNSIVEEVLKRLESRLKKATVVFTGGSGGFVEALEQVKLLKDDGWELKVVLSNSAEYVLTPQYIKNKLEIPEVYLEREVKGLRQFYDGIGAFIIPTLTLNTAVKISLGVADNLTTNLASHIIMTGVPFIAARDACDLRSPIRKQIGLDKAPNAYVEMADSHLDNLQSYGITLVEAEDLYEAVQERVLTFSAKPQVYAPEEQTDIHVLQKNVLTRSDIILAKQKRVNLKVSRSVILSPLALETAQELGVKIIQE